MESGLQHRKGRTRLADVFLGMHTFWRHWKEKNFSVHLMANFKEILPKCLGRCIADYTRRSVGFEIADTESVSPLVQKIRESLIVL